MLLYDAKDNQISFIKQFLMSCSFSPYRVEKEKAQAVEQQAKVSGQQAGITAQRGLPSQQGPELQQIDLFSQTQANCVPGRSVLNSSGYFYNSLSSL